MSTTFNPSPFDKHAVSPEEAARLDQETSRNLKAGLVGTFPASDPVSATMPPPTREPRRGLLEWILSIFR